MSHPPATDFILGIDLGSNSLGWALLQRTNREPSGILRAGVRIFEAGTEGDRESGQEESRNRARREARLARRQIWRRARRIRKIFRLLQSYALLPPGNGADPLERQKLLNELDQSIPASPWFKAKSRAYAEPQHTLPYILRAAALDEKLEPHYLGRAVFHLAQRRGFLSNRKAAPKKDEKPGEVKEGINKLQDAMNASGSRTLGEYFAHLSPSEERIRHRWTSRKMYEDEFEKVWQAQAAHHTDILTPQQYRELRRALFHQRPLRVQKDLIGHCELEPDERRAPAYLLLSQRFRLLQTVNNLKVTPLGEVERSLTNDQRSKLLEALELEGDQTFAAVRKLLGFKRNAAFNLERGGEKTLKGNRTASQFYGVFRSRWPAMSAEERDRAVGYVYSFQKPDKLVPAAMKKWNLDEASAKALGEITFEPDYLNLSRKAMQNFLNLLEAGVTYGEARRTLYPESFLPKQPLDTLPRVNQEAGKLRNPAVERSLTELRKVVNALVRQHGKPAEIHVELARDLKRSKKNRQELADRMRQNENLRKRAAELIRKEAGIANPKPRDIERVLLAGECHWQCVYCPEPGKSAAMKALVGDEPQFQADHILPFSKSLDNSFVNKTLCCNECNAQKGNRTPFEAFGSDPQRYQLILDRVRRFSGDRWLVAEKLRRVQMTPDEVEDFRNKFTERQLNDTRYATKQAAQYLGQLYGGINDASGQRIIATAGQMTAYLRSEWKLNAILSDGPSSGGGAVPKSRDDHRHHAVDAVAIALTDQSTIKRLSDAAQRAPLEHRRRFGTFSAPWPDFVDSVRKVIGGIVVSHRVSKKISGALHEETIYSRPFPVAAVSDRRTVGGEHPAATVVHVRKPLPSLSKNEVEEIVDAGVRKLVQAKLAELGGDPKKFADEKNLPRFPSSGVPIKRARVTKALPVFTLGQGNLARRVTLESNHHLEIYAELDGHGNEKKWGGEVVSLAEAYERLKKRIPIIQRDHGPLVKLKFSLAPGEVVECDDGKAGRRVLVMRSVSEFTGGTIQMGFAPVNDARQKADVIAAREWVRVVPNRLRQLNARKVVVSPLGEVSEAHE